MSIYTLSAQNEIQFGFNRFNDNISFDIIASVDQKTKFGNILVNQMYGGNATLLGNQINHNDNQNLDLKLYYELNDFQLSFIQNLDYVGDNYSDFSTSSLFNTQEILATSYKINQANILEVYYGIDNHRQLDVTSFGSVYGSNFKYSIDYQNWDFFGKVNLDRISRSLERVEHKNMVLSNLSQTTDESSLKITANYSSLSNNLLRQSLDEIFIENRNEDNYNLQLAFDYKLAQSLNNRININYFDFTRDNSFREYEPNISKSGITEQRIQRSFKVNNSLSCKQKNHLTTLELEYYDERLLNSATNRNLTENDFRSELSDLKLLDYNNYYSRVRITSKNKITKNLVSNSIFLVEINRFDTPSDRENRDRDQLIFRIGEVLSKRFSKYFTANLEFDGRFRHLVFLRSEFSSDNKWERILKFSPFFNIKYANFENSPRFEIYVRYNSYDFEQISSQIRSDAQRILRISDTLSYRFDSKYSLRSRFYFLYKETGKLDWDNFTQSIDEVKNEVFLNTLIYLSKGNSLFGFGLRYYQIDNQIKVDSPFNSNLRVSSISPETEINWFVGNFTKIKIAGLFEFQNRNGILITIPNLYLQTQLRF